LVAFITTRRCSDCTAVRVLPSKLSIIAFIRALFIGDLGNTGMLHA
jgi:hypothetical protein